MQCPLCHTMDTGKVGTNQYYCWQCLMEFKTNAQQQARMYYVEADGSLIPVVLKQE
ncbi:MAG: hypothetical protein AB1767_07095 [Bacillota bacterium]